jgi:hypothetical protein
MMDGDVALRATAHGLAQPGAQQPEGGAAGQDGSPSPVWSPALSGEDPTMAMVPGRFHDQGPHREVRGTWLFTREGEERAGCDKQAAAVCSCSLLLFTSYMLCVCVCAVPSLVSVLGQLG